MTAATEVAEAMIFDAHCPSMTARFRIPSGLPLASGMYELRWVRTPTAADEARWTHLPEPPDDFEALSGAIDALRVAHAAIKAHAPHLQVTLGVINDALDRAAAS